MLAERIAKLYLQSGQNVLPARSRRSLPGTIREFDSGLRDLSAAAPTTEIRENYLLLRRLWDEYAAIAGKPPAVDGAKKLSERSEELAWVAAKGARLYQGHWRDARIELVMAAGEMRWRSQQIAKLHLLRGWGIRSEAIAADVAIADAAYRKAAQLLRAAPETTPEIAAELQIAENQYPFLGQAAERLASRKSAAQELEFIAKTSDNLLEVLDRVARLYEGPRN